LLQTDHLRDVLESPLPFSIICHLNSSVVARVHLQVHSITLSRVMNKVQLRASIVSRGRHGTDRTSCQSICFEGSSNLFKTSLFCRLSKTWASTCFADCQCRWLAIARTYTLASQSTELGETAHIDSTKSVNIIPTSDRGVPFHMLPPFLPESVQFKKLLPILRQCRVC
jgi:hypothetical protein